MGNRYVELAARLHSGDFTRNGNVLLALAPMTINHWRDRHRNTDVYAGVFQRLGPQLQSLPLGDFYFDLDTSVPGDNWLAALDEVQSAAVRILDVLVDDLDIPEDLVHIGFTGHKGFDMRVPHQCFGVQPHAALARRYKMMALDVARRATAMSFIDKNVYDGRRVLRLFNSVHSGASRHLGHAVYKVPLTVTELISEDIASIVSLASRPRPMPKLAEKPQPVPAALELYNDAEQAVEQETVTRREDTSLRAASLPRSCSMPPCMAYLSEHGAPQGFRNNALFQLAIFLHRRKGMDVEKIILQVSGFGGLDSSEITATVKSATRSSYKVGCRSRTSRLWELVEDGVTVCDRDRCPILEGF